MPLPPTKEGDIINEPLTDLPSILVHINSKHGYIPRHTFRVQGDYFIMEFLESADSVEPETKESGLSKSKHFR